MSQSASLDLTLHPKQGEALQTIATEILYGGAAGGGKSHLMRGVAVLWAAAIPGLQVYLFRRVYVDLIKNHMEGPKGFRAMLAGWSQCGFVKIVDDEIRFWNGSKIYLCHCQHEKDVYKYQGAEIHVLLIDELTHFSEPVYRFLRNRLRMVGLNVPPEMAGKFPRIMCGANPGNIGHLWVKATFVDGVVPMALRDMPVEEGGMIRQYIPARLDDNPSMATDDPGYEMRLQGLGSEALVRAMRYGDWDVVEGAFFDNWRADRHVIRPFAIPPDWTRFRSFDWGSAAPFSVGWWAVVSDWHRTDCGAWLPRGAMVRYREWYGAASPNVGLKLTAEDVAAGVVSRSPEGEKAFAFSVCDTSIFSEDGGPSIGERMMRAGWRGLRPADKRRVPGWDQVRSRLSGQDFGDPHGDRPMMYVFSTCLDTIRTLPSMQHDTNKPEDIDSDGEDHACDDIRYACQSRPYARPISEPPKPPKLIQHATYADMMPKLGGAKGRGRI